ncbi:MAG: prolipoprotein diacylglyceryl transferase family protein [Thermonemataceae bacterium]
MKTRFSIPLSPHWHIFGRTYNIFLLLGIVGFLLGSTLGVKLAYLTGLDVVIAILISVVAALTFFTFAWLSKLFTGQENIIYYRQEIAIVCTTLLVLYSLQQPILPYLDLTLLGVGILVCIGRWGCLSAGCCYGKPCSAKVGICYQKTHAQRGFPVNYVGVKLWPVPLWESIVLFINISIGVILLLRHYLEGTFTIWYTTTYGVMRFGFEYLRGDARPYLWHFSEAQWITLGLLSLSSLLAHYGTLPYYAAHLWITLGLWGVVIGSFLFYRFGDKQWLQLHGAKHLQEIARGLALLPEQPTAEVPLLVTSLGLTISYGKIRQATTNLHHYTLSSKNTTYRLTPQTSKQLAEIIRQLRHSAQTYQVKFGKKGIVQVIFIEKIEKTNELNS